MSYYLKWAVRPNEVVVKIKSIFPELGDYPQT